MASANNKRDNRQLCFCASLTPYDVYQLANLSISYWKWNGYEIPREKYKNGAYLLKIQNSLMKENRVITRLLVNII